MEAVLLVVLVVAASTLAAYRMVARWDPPYRGTHEAGGGRHREREWEGGQGALE